MAQRIRSAAFLFFLGLFLLCSSLPAAAEEATVTLAIPYPTPVLDHLADKDPVQRIIFQNIGIGLTRSALHGAAELDGASGMKILEGGRVWEFELPEKLQFPTGRRLDASGAADSLRVYQSLLNGPGSSNTSTRIMESLSSIKTLSGVPGSSTLRIELDKADLAFSLGAAALPIIDTEVREALGSSYGTGTQISLLGVYQVIKNDGEFGVVLGSVPELFWLKPHRVARIELRYFRSADRMLRKLRYGIIDIIPLPTSGQLAAAAEDPAFQVVPSPLSNLLAEGENWSLPIEHWGAEPLEANRLMTSHVIMRKDVALDRHFLARFDLSQIAGHITQSPGQ